MLAISARYCQSLFSILYEKFDLFKKNFLIYKYTSEGHTPLMFLCKCSKLAE